MSIFAQVACNQHYPIPFNLGPNCQQPLVILTNPISCPSAHPYTLVFEDNFDGNTLNPDYWDKQLPWGKGMFGLACAEPENAIVNNGKLKLTAIEENKSEFLLSYCENGSSDITNCLQSDGYPNYRDFYFTSGCAYLKIPVKYGKFEISCKIPNIDGVWPAFWLFGGVDGQEIDVFDGFRASEFSDGADEHNKRIRYGWIRKDGGNGVSCCQGGDYYSNTDYHLGFHTFSIEWDEYSIIWRVDGIIYDQMYRYHDELGQIVNCENINTGVYAQSQLPNIPLNVIINLQVQRFCGGNGSTNCPCDDCFHGAFPTTFEIEYIKIWKRENDCCIDNKLFEATDNLPTKTGVTDYIRAGNDAGIPDINGEVTVKTGQDISFNAGNYIELAPGFTVEAGAGFTAKIEECSSITQTTGDDITGISFPSSFSPDGDGIDDKLFVSVNGATSYTIRVEDKDPPYNTFYYEEDIPITTNPVCVWDGNCDMNCGIYHKCNRQRRVIIAFENCDKYLAANSIVDVTCSTLKTIQEDSLSNSATNENLLNDNENAKTFFEIIPNPNDGNMQLHYDLPLSSKYEFAIYDVLGKRISSIALNPENKTENYSINLNTGIYYYKLTDKTKQLKIGKIIINSK